MNDDFACQWDGTVFPDMIRNLPEVEVPFEDIRGWLLSGDDRQVVFFDILPTATVPAHSHCAQWGLMIEGEMDITIDGTTRRVGKGDWYFIPEGVEHSAVFLSRVNVIDMFDARDRYKAKTK
jgi:quercetin dioxygenase-like cupin family protein